MDRNAKRTLAQQHGSITSTGAQHMRETMAATVLRLRTKVVQVGEAAVQEDLPMCRCNLCKLKQLPNTEQKQREYYKVNGMHRGEGMRLSHILFSVFSACLVANRVAYGVPRLETI